MGQTLVTDVRCLDLTRAVMQQSLTGRLVIQLGFQTGDQKYKFMEDKQYVASQRYIKSPSSSVLSLEFKISEVA
jgi:hypothetical protein